MTKKILSVVLILTFSFFSASADEGMWLPHLLKSMNEADMQECGLQLTAQDLYDVNNSSLKDAIVSFGGFCTGEMISSEGLVLTNHHCGYGQIQEHSSLRNDYLKDGFWAMTRDEELPNDGLFVSFLVSIESVTDRVLEELGDVSQSERNQKLRLIFNSIISESTEGTNYNARVKSFFGGNEFYLMKYVTYNDVRLVGAPPSSIGKYGGDTDNWMWPRHTGDFALFRVYCAPDGSPAEYSEENIPYTPKHHLPIQLDGVDNGDYTMIFGFPGRTDRYLTSFGIQQALDQTNPTIVQIRQEKLSIMKAGMDASKKTKIQYASKHAQTSNYWKYYIGQSKGLKRMKVYDKKLAIQDQFIDWVNSGDENRYEKYGNVLNIIEEAYDQNKKINIARTYLNEAIFQGAEIMYFSYLMNRKLENIPSDEKEKRKLIKDIKMEAKEYYKNYNSTIDEELFSSMLEMYYYNVPKNQHPSVFKRIEQQLFGFKALDFDYYARNVFRRSIFSSKEKFFEFLDNPSKMKLDRDPAYTTMMSIYDYYLENHYQKRLSVRSKLDEGNRLFIAGLREMNPDIDYYPNANSTMRVTYGNVGDYSPGNGAHYDYYTTIEGIMEKEDPSDDEFIVPEKLKELYYLGDYGQYADKDGNLRINFISNNDITGGNSGSPVINAWGELVGTAFDGNWEAMSGDIVFENEIQRTISVDIRYILFIIDKYAGATHLIDEMTIAPNRPEKMTSEELVAMELENAFSDPNTIVKPLEMKEYMGTEIPVFDMHSFGSAFDMAVEQYGASNKQLFWWKGNVYTTEVK
ncbi:MAG: serine protease [Flavobacteriales bacterium]|nr:serine protease [Flavobacteriales bacterium]|tara:strand:- start:6370 stop:8769 length:2400 start_codon:yes stop_codon:yes gene_type:complete